MSIIKIFHTKLLFLALSLMLLTIGCSNLQNELSKEDIGILEKTYLEGKQHEMNKDINRAYSSYLKAANKGYAPAQAAAGFIKYRYHANEPDNMMIKLGSLVLSPTAKLFFELAAKQNNAAGQYGLGELYSYGKGGAEQNVEQALNLYEQAAQQGYMDAQATLGELYFYGRHRKKLSSPHVPKNLERARMWREKAARQGHVNSQYELGLAYHQEKNFQLAKQWYEQAAAQGHYDAQLGLMLLSGKAGHYPCYVRGPYGIPIRQPGIARRSDDWCL